MASLYYYGAYTDSGCEVGCDHKHETVISAAACISAAGGYVVAVQDGNPRRLNDKEEMEYVAARYGVEEPKGKVVSALWVDAISNI